MIQGRDLSNYKSVIVKSFDVLYYAHSRGLGSATQEVSSSLNLRFAPSESPEPWTAKPFLVPVPALASSQAYQGSAVSPSGGILVKRHRHHHHRKSHHAVSPLPSIISECDKITCADPLTAVPFGSPYGCVLPMKAQILQCDKITYCIVNI